MPIYLLYLHASELSVVTEKFKRVDIPSSRTTLLMTGSSFKRTREVWPRIVGVYGTFHGLRHNLYLRDTLTSLSMGCADAIRPRVSSTDYEHVLSLGGYALLFAELHSCQHSILLGE